MSFQDVGKPGGRPKRSHLTAQPSISEGRPSSSLPKSGGDPFAQLSDGILQYQVCVSMLSTTDSLSRYLLLYTLSINSF
jgi:hypothetical protein